jgi:peptidoglycan/LPS O-acetylase OafA/YrhL
MTEGRDKPARRIALGYLPGLDGIRALGIVAVIAFHAGLPGSAGGFLGVDVFFVVSGFLITTLLIHEFRVDRTIGLRSFWLRRARRLLPALFALLIVVAALLATVARQSARSERGDIVAALAYVSNWYQLSVQRSYFAGFGRPPLLRHLWSLAVEEQFYVVWPLVVFGFLRFTKKKRTMPRAFFVGAFASTVVMIALFQRFVKNPLVDDVSSVYLRTDTRAAGLLIGAAVAAMFYRVLALTAAVGGTPSSLIGSRKRFGKLNHADLLGAVGFVVVVAAMIAANRRTDWLYNGGFLLVSLGTAGLIIGCTHPQRWLFHRRRFDGLVARLRVPAGFAPLQWLGQRSYGLYLWHWPLFQFTRPAEDFPHAPVWFVQASRIIGALIIAEVSFRLIEQPLRHWKPFGPRSTSGLSTLRSPRVLGLTIVVCMLVSALSVRLATVPRVSSDVEAMLKANAQAMKQREARIANGLPEDSAAVVDTAAAVDSVAPIGSSIATTTRVPATTTIPWKPLDVRGFAVGDSVQLGASVELAKRFRDQFHIDAEVSRNFTAGLDVAVVQASMGDVGDVLVVHLGNNGPIDQKVFDSYLDRFSSVPLIILVNLHVGNRPFVNRINAMLAAEAKKRSNVVVADWRSVAIAHRNVFYDDDTHVRPEFAGIYGDLIADVVARECSLQSERRSASTTTTTTTTTTLASTTSSSIVTPTSTELPFIVENALVASGDNVSAEYSVDPPGPVVFRPSLPCIRPGSVTTSTLVEAQPTSSAPQR